MRNINWIFRLFISISLSVFVAYLFRYPKTIIEHFTNRNAIHYFISDLNRFTYVYTKINIFYSYILYFPFVYFAFCFIAFKFVSKQICVKIIRGYILRTYTHVITICFIHFDFALRATNCLTESFFFNIQTIDVTNILIQYSGLYWDFIMVIWFINLISILCIEVNRVRPYSNYAYIINGIINGTINDITKALIQFGNILNTVWVLRITLYGINRYFFGGECRASDMCVMLIGMFIVEFIIFSFRFFFLLKQYNVC